MLETINDTIELLEQAYKNVKIISETLNDEGKIIIGDLPSKIATSKFSLLYLLDELKAKSQQ